jgi:hypothetical protein
MEICLLLNQLNYLYNLENILEVTIIELTFFFLASSCHKMLSAVTLLLAWMEVMLLLGCFTRLTVYNEMMKRVALNYVKFLIWNLPLIVAFSFSFYLLNHKENPSEGNGGNSCVNNASSNSSSQNANVDFYSYFHLSLLKTVVMMIGEFDASSMSFDIGSYFVFFFFVFMMATVVINLLNGLAVSDTQTIWKEAELVAYRSRVTLVLRYDSVLFGGPFNPLNAELNFIFLLLALVGVHYFVDVSRIRVNNPCMRQPTGESPSLPQGSFQEPIILFQDSLKEGYWRNILNKVKRFIGFYMERSDREEGGRPFTCCKIFNFRFGLNIDREVLIAAKKIADRKQMQSRHESSQIVNRIAKVEEDLKGCMDQLAKLEELIKQLKTTVDAN